MGSEVCIRDSLGTGRQLVRFELTPPGGGEWPARWTNDDNSAYGLPTGAGLNAVNVNFTISHPAATFSTVTNESAVGILDGDAISCGGVYAEADPLDLDGDGVNVSTVSNSFGSGGGEICTSSRTYNGTGAAAVISVSKSATGDTAGATPITSGSTALVGPGSVGSYELVVTNDGFEDLTSPVLYDILPHVGDTGIGAALSSVGRGSQWDAEFESVTLPAGWSVEFSTSTNPCRGELHTLALADAPAGCVNDWTTVQPADSAIAALRFTAPGLTLETDESAEAITVEVTAPNAEGIAWNSVAATAEDEDGHHLVGAEVAKVGLELPALARSLGVAKAAVFNDEDGDGFADDGETITYTLR